MQIAATRARRLLASPAASARLACASVASLGVPLLPRPDGVPTASPSSARRFYSFAPQPPQAWLWTMIKKCCNKEDIKLLFQILQKLRVSGIPNLIINANFNDHLCMKMTEACARVGALDNGNPRCIRNINSLRGKVGKHYTPTIGLTRGQHLPDQKKPFAKDELRKLTAGQPTEVIEMQKKDDRKNCLVAFPHPPDGEEEAMLAAAARARRLLMFPATSGPPCVLSGSCLGCASGAEGVLPLLGGIRGSLHLVRGFCSVPQSRINSAETPQDHRHQVLDGLVGRRG
ncbi:uncharacterized protein LOC133926465 isoform X2 [Phragmites australis]|uniref:uncharacterized protein LOC133926465 isoform X2 n=1 Tax=Phragmites australis TaxID=29695 RepID=UPI002D79A4A1|nr:uncharacterized protein LOC133926465 isoform X2 [Phragmites australis]